MKTVCFIKYVLRVAGWLVLWEKQGPLTQTTIFFHPQWKPHPIVLPSSFSSSTRESSIEGNWIIILHLWMWFPIELNQLIQKKNCLIQYTQQLVLYTKQNLHVYTFLKQKKKTIMMPVRNNLEWKNSLKTMNAIQLHCKPRTTLLLHHYRIRLLLPVTLIIDLARILSLQGTIINNPIQFSWRGEIEQLPTVGFGAESIEWAEQGHHLGFDARSFAIDFTKTEISWFTNCCGERERDDWVGEGRERRGRFI